MSEPRTAARDGWEARVVRPGDGADLDALDAEYWARIPMDDRAEAAWQLSLEMWRIAEPDVDHEARHHGFPEMVISPERFDDLIAKKRATGRHRDLADAEALELTKRK